MRARHRHFNPKDAGAIAAYDSRYITGLTNGDAVATWSSRTGLNDATQTTAGQRPTYNTNQVNGNPVVTFDSTGSPGISIDELNISITIPNSLTALTLIRRNSTTHNSGSFGNTSTARFTAYFYVNNVVYTNFSSEVVWGTPLTTTGTFILTTAKNGTTTSQVYINGSSWNAAKTPAASSNSFTKLGGMENGSWHNGAMGFASLVDSFVSDGLRKRMEHAIAYSFKISCN